MPTLTGWRPLALFALAVASVNCTFLVNHDRAQCNSDGDCAARGTAFDGTFCSLDTNTCVSNLDYCKTNSECVQRNGGQNYICHKDQHTCANLLSPFCTKLYAEPGDVANDDTVFLGAMLSPSANQAFLAADRSVDLARQELKAAGYLLGVKGGPHRPVALISCDVPSAGKSQQVLDTANHLIDDARVVGIIGPVDSPSVATAIQTSIPKKTPLISPGSTADAITNTPGRTDLVYRLSLTDSLGAKKTVTLVDQYIEPELRAGATPVIPAGTPMRVALMREGTVLGSSIASTIFDSIHFNGNKTAATNIQDGNYKEFNLGQNSDPDFASKIAAGIAGILAYKPHLIILNGGSISASSLQVEQNWPAGTPKPKWVGTQNAVTSVISDYVVAEPTARNRFAFFAEAPALDDPGYVKYQLTYDGLFPNAKDSTTTHLSAGAYDAVYMYFYAIASLLDSPVTPAAVGKAIRDVAGPNGTTVAFGVDPVGAALGILNQGGKIRYSGARGIASFGPTGDDIGSSGYFVCPNLAPNPTFPYVSSGLSVDANDKVVGTSTCF